MFEKAKEWTKDKFEKTKKWVKENPAEAVCLFGGTVIGVITGGTIGKAVGTKKGRIEGVNIGYKAKSDEAWAAHCSLFGWDPSNDSYEGDMSKPLHTKLGDYIKVLQENADPESYVSGRLVFDDTVHPVSHEYAIEHNGERF